MTPKCFMRRHGFPWKVSANVAIALSGFLALPTSALSLADLPAGSVEFYFVLDPTNTSVDPPTSNSDHWDAMAVAWQLRGFLSLSSSAVADFWFINNTDLYGVPSGITQVDFYDSTVDPVLDYENGGVTFSSGVNFEYETPTQPHSPEGRASRLTAQANTVNAPAEWLNVSIPLVTTVSFPSTTSLLAALASRQPDFNIRLHVTSIGATEDSDWYDFSLQLPPEPEEPPVVPEPATFGLLGLGMAAAALRRSWFA